MKEDIIEIIKDISDSDLDYSKLESEVVGNLIFQVRLLLIDIARTKTKNSDEYKNIICHIKTLDFLRGEYEKTEQLKKALGKFLK